MEKLNGDSRTLVCADCGCIIDEENEKFYTLPNGKVICESCFERDYFECESCGDIVKIVYGYEADGDCYCQDCFFEEYTICDGCGGNMTMYDGYCLCDNCYDYMQGVDRCGYARTKDWNECNKCDLDECIYWK